MVSKIELINHCVDSGEYSYNKETDELTSNDSNFSVSATALLMAYKNKSGESFECIYDDHACCFNIIKCTECGTHVFEHYNEDYDPNLKCPTCVDYTTHFKYYTAKDIEEDVNKQKEIKMYLDFAKMADEAEARYIKRGLYDWEKTRKFVIFKNKKTKVYFQILGSTKHDLKAEFNVYSSKDNNDECFVMVRYIHIPLSLYTLKYFIKGKIKWNLKLNKSN